MALSARQKQTLQKIGAKLAAARRELEENANKALERLDAFDRELTAANEESRKDVRAARTTLRETLDERRASVAEAARDFNDAGEELDPDDPIEIDSYQLEQLEQPLDDSDFGYLLEDLADEEKDAALLQDVEVPDLRKQIESRTKAIREQLDEGLVDARKDPDEYLASLDDLPGFLGEDDYAEYLAVLEGEG